MLNPNQPETTRAHTANDQFLRSLDDLSKASAVWITLNPLHPTAEMARGLIAANNDLKHFYGSPNTVSKTVNSDCKILHKVCTGYKVLHASSKELISDNWRNKLAFHNLEFHFERICRAAQTKSGMFHPFTDAWDQVENKGGVA